MEPTALGNMIVGALLGGLAVSIAYDIARARCKRREAEQPGMASALVEMRSILRRMEIDLSTIRLSVMARELMEGSKDGGDYYSGPDGGVGVTAKPGGDDQEAGR